MESDYEKLKAILDVYYANPTDEMKSKTVLTAISILFKKGIRFRNLETHQIIQFNISIPKSKPSCIVFGIRYLKLYTAKITTTEDHFLFDKKAKGVQKGEEGKWIEKLFPEYKGSHKKSIFVDVLDALEESRKTGITDKIMKKLNGSKIEF